MNIKDIFIQKKYPTHYLLRGNWKTHKLKTFEEINKKGLVAFKCPDCSQEFGLDADFLENSSNLNVKYTCPYCDKKHALKNP